MGELRLYNTLTRRKEPFHPSEGNTVRMYTCGPTVYDVIHVGNLRTFLFFDVLRRCLRLKGFQVHHVMNITDVDDKTVRASIEQGVPLSEITDKYIAIFLRDLETVHIEQPEHMPRATDYVPHMVQFIGKLLEKGYAYVSGDSVWYRISAFPEYGKLSGRRPESQSTEYARIEAQEYKDEVGDFALWKGAKPGEPSWDSPWGPGRPGWFTECCVMAQTILGDTIDLHSGGADLIFPHHENEIAQAEAATGKPFSRFWVHPGFLQLEGEKISKSLGNILTLTELLDEGYAPEAIRLNLIATAHYRNQYNFTREGLDNTAQALNRLHDFIDRLDEQMAGLPEDSGDGDDLAATAAQADRSIEAEIDDDLNLPGALGHVFDLMRTANAAMAEGDATRAGLQSARQVLRKLDQVFACFEHEKALLDDEIQRLIEERDEARQRRDFARADAIRTRLADQGIALEDSPAGTRWRRLTHAPGGA
jgi:cysteinyl-tRNA synthetase